VVKLICFSLACLFLPFLHPLTRAPHSSLSFFLPSFNMAIPPQRANFQFHIAHEVSSIFSHNITYNSVTILCTQHTGVLQNARLHLLLQNSQDNIFRLNVFLKKKKKKKTPWAESASELYRPPLWSSGQSSWLQIRRPGFDSRH
jgi:hypothetical protein